MFQPGLYIYTGNAIPDCAIVYCVIPAIKKNVDGTSIISLANIYWLIQRRPGFVRRSINLILAVNAPYSRSGASVVNNLTGAAI